MASVARKKIPRVTVLMPVYNGARYLPEAIESILGQTFVDFELLIIDDGSTDESATVVAGYPDDRIRLIRQPSNRGLITALNLGLELSRGEFVARMDADDISLPLRLSRQVEYLDNHPEVGICGSWLEAFADDIRTQWVVPTKHDEIICSLVFESVMYHPTVMLRKQLLADHGLRYDALYPHAEDYELWSRCGQYFQLANMDEVLVYYRLHEQSVGQTQATTKLQSANRVRGKMIERLNLACRQEELTLHCSLGIWQQPGEADFLKRSHAWLLRLQSANAVMKCYPEPDFSRVLALRWQFVCCQASFVGLSAFRLYRRSPFRNHAKLPLKSLLFFWMSCVLKCDRRHPSTT
ncbi:MAG: hypothetical protein A2091_02805 [Desulfuromonadales bacterium GWD2_61_12]|nr:MAG: hypothetical protein A2091_02805 [Desulfuromonadales bacterium GWD2_61_12]